MTPRYFDLLLEKQHQRRRDEVHHRDFMLSQIVEMVANTGNLRWDRPRQWQEFMPRYAQAAVKRRRRRTARESAEFDVQIARSMVRLVEYQEANAKRAGIVR